MRFISASRINTPAVFDSAFTTGQRIYLKAGMYIIQPNQLLIARLGLIIAKKKLRHAVQRNRLKRIQRECFRQAQQAFLGYDIIFVANHKVSGICQNEWFALCQTDWQSLAKRLSHA